MDNSLYPALAYASHKLDEVTELKEGDHAKLLYVALCPFEARTIIAAVAVRALDAMVEKGFPGGGCPFELVGYPEEHQLAHPMPCPVCEKAYLDGVERWRGIIQKMRGAFALMLKDDLEFDEEETKEIEDGLLLFAQYALCLWL